MSKPDVDFDGARNYVMATLRNGLDSHLTYHSLEHTLNDVLPAAERLAALEGVPEDELVLLRTAALFHDVGFLTVYEGHEVVGVEVARRELPHFGYDEEQIECIASMIMATKLPQSPTTLLEEIMADADLDVLGREDFLSRNTILREELAAIGRTVTDEVWYRSQIGFMKNHRYFTKAAVTLRRATKKENIGVLASKLEALADQKA
ncbi:MAG: HD domain-containing protein [Trueperaceae bacterium]|nr:MAG: HD domain-containing protein [Trueperaceae bacterium]